MPQEKKKKQSFQFQLLVPTSRQEPEETVTIWFQYIEYPRSYMDAS